jgi:hypothetical protein
MNEELLEMRLWEYIDGKIDAAEKMQIEELLRTDVRWQTAYKQLLQINKMLQNDLELEEPSMGFTKNVMEGISKLKIAPATKNYINRKIVNGIAAFFVLMIGGLLIYFLTQVNWSSSGESGFSFSFDISKVDVSKYFNKQAMQIFAMVNAVLALILLDKIFLRKRTSAKHY